MSLQLNSSYESIYQRARVYEQMGDTEKALEELRRLVKGLERLKPSALERRPELKELYEESANLLADLEARAENFDEAIALLEKLIARNPQDTGIMAREIATLEVARGDVEQGLSDLHALVEAEPHNPWHSLILGDTLVDLQRCEEAREILYPLAEGRWTGEEGNIPAWASQRLFDCAEESNNPSEAIRAWQLVRKSEPDEDGAQKTLWRLVALLAQQGDFNAARAHVEKVQSWHVAQFLRGYAQSRSGDAEAAQLIWQRTEEREPQTPLDVEGSIRAYLMLGRGKEAHDLLGPYLSTPSSTWTVTVLAGIAEADQGRVEEAIGFLENALEQQRQFKPLRKLPLYERRLWEENFADSEVWQSLAPFFDEEPT